MKQHSFSFVLLSIWLVFPLFVAWSQAAPGACTSDNQCKNHGHCIDHLCNCNSGYYGDYCTIGINKVYPVLWYFIRIFCAVVYFCLTVATIRTIVLNLRNEKKQQTSTGTTSGKWPSITTMSLVMIALVSVDMTLYYAIDPENFEHIAPLQLDTAFIILLFPLISVTYVTILFYWAEIYDRTTRVLHREDMLQRVNTQYQRNITLQEMLNKVNILNRLRIPLIIANILGFLFAFAEIALIGTLTANSVGAVYGVYYVIIYLVESIGFIIYGRKLVAFLPGFFKNKMRSKTNLITGLAVVFLITFVIYLAFAFLAAGSKVIYVTNHIIINLCTWTNLVLMLMLFVRFSIKFGVSTQDGSNAQTTATVEEELEGHLADQVTEKQI